MHYLPAAAEVTVKESLNGPFYVTFTYPKLSDDNERYAAIIERNEVRFPSDLPDVGLAGQIFVIKRVDEERRGLRIYKRVEAHHVAFELNRYYLDYYVDFTANVPPTYQLGLIGNNTPFAFAVEGSFNSADVFEFGEKRKHELLNDVRTLYNGDLSYDNTAITLATRKGANNGVVIRYRKNLTGIVRKSHDMERITRLYGYGKNGLTIEGLPGHSVKYIDSQYIDVNHIFEGSIDFPEIEDQSRLLAEMQRYITTVELPKVSYEIDFVELEKVDPEFKSEATREVGDTITVIDESMGYRFDARITEYERYPFEPKRGRVVLANFREMKTSDYIFQATVGSRKAMVYTSENAVLKGIKYDDSITLVDGMGMRVADAQDRTMVRLGQTAPGEYGLALFNKSGVRTIWQDSATGNAYFSGTLQAAVVNGSVINGSTINAGTINGTTVTGSLIQTIASGNYPRAEMSNTSSMFKVEASNAARIEMRSYGSTSPSPSLEFSNGGSLVSMTPTNDPATGLYINGPALHAELNRITLRGYNGVYFLNWASIRSEGLGGGVSQSLQQALDAKATWSYVQILETRVSALESA
ncbi:phage tail spike protein [Paenibacillus sp. NPDC057967]|uniref:phage tail spike protein n=1 Tax=Paenibacillus sp. NPDC057967 TaxID=3346293 RepID=UPI0036DB9E93